MAEAAEAITHTHFTGHGAHGAAGYGENAYRLDLAAEVKLILLVSEIIGAAARADNHADFSLLVKREFSVVNARIFEGLTGGGKGHGHRPRYVLALFGFHPIQCIE